MRLKVNNQGLLQLGKILFLFYIFFLYIQDSGMIPATIVSLCLYGFLGSNILSICLSHKFVINNYMRWWLIFMGLCVVSFFLSGMKTQSAMEKIMIIFFLTMCLSHMITGINDVILIAKWFFIAASVLVALLIITGQLFLSRRLGMDLVGNANSFANKLLFPGIIGLWLVIYEKKSMMRWVYIFCEGLIVFAVALTGGRKILLSIGVCFVFLYFENSRNSFVKRIRNLVIVIVLLIASIYLIKNIPVLYKSIGVRFFARNRFDVMSDNLRIQYVKIGFDGWLEKPFFGHGIDMFKNYNVLITGESHYSHNNYIEMLFDFGIVGFSIYYGFIIVCINRLRKLPDSLLQYKSIGLSLIIAILLFDIGGISYFSNLNQIMILFAFILSNREKYNTGIAE